MVMISAGDLKGGTTFLFNNKPFQVVKYEHTKMGRGSASIRINMRNLETGDLREQTFTPNNKFEEIATLKQQLQYLYNDGDIATFMHPENYNQFEIPISTLGNALSFIKEGSLVNVLFWDPPDGEADQALSVEVPSSVVLEVSQTEKGVKGNSATNVFKPATLENGLEMKVPLFIKIGDKIKVKTSDSSYVERVNEKS